MVTQHQDQAYRCIDHCLAPSPDVVSIRTDQLIKGFSISTL
jgi:hypothetical protein